MTRFSIGAALLLFGCGASLGPASGRESGWIEARSEHFVVKTELAPEAADATAIELERMFAAFEQVAYPHQPKPKFVTEIVVFESKRSLEELGHREVGGVMVSRFGADLEERRTLVTYGKLGGKGREGVRRVFQHELAHRFTAFYFPAAPIWLAEGLSELFSTLAIDDTRVVVGGYVEGTVFTSNPWAVARGSEGWFVNVPLSAAPSVRELTSYSLARFYGEDASADPASDAARRECAKNYAAAWNLVHLLLLGNTELRGRFNRYLQAIARGERSPSEAWSAEFAEIEPELERAYRALLPQTTRTVAAVPFHAPPAARPFLQPLTPAEVHLLLAGIRKTEHAEQDELADGDLERAVALGSDQADPHFVRAFRRFGSGDASGARVDLGRARALAPRDARVFQLELMIALERGQLQLAEQSAFELSRRAKTAAQLGLLALYYAKTGKPKTAERFARYGIRTDSTCSLCFAALGEADAALGRKKSAVVAVNTAMHLLPEDDRRRRKLRARLAELAR